MVFVFPKWFYFGRGGSLSLFFPGVGDQTYGLVHTRETLLSATYFVRSVPGVLGCQKGHQIS